jgi:hypothetical protein
LEEITGKQEASPAVAAVVAAALAPSEPQPSVAALASGTTTVPPAVLQSGETEPASIFGNTLIAKIAISLAAGAVTFLVGTVALYAYMTMANH